MTWRFALMLLGLSSASAAYADARIQRVQYNADRIVAVHARNGVQTMIEFGPDERLENIALGDAAAWQVTPNKRANLLFLKPLSARAHTNMTVVTDRRRYLFDLVAGPHRGMPVYVLRFDYPEELALAQVLDDAQGATKMSEAVAAPAAPPGPHTNWQMSGDRALFPEQVYDDGSATYIKWNAKADFPAIFAYDADGTEGPANFTVRDDMIVLEGLANRYTLRIGKARAVLTRPANSAPLAAKDIAK